MKLACCHVGVLELALLLAGVVPTRPGPASDELPTTADAQSTDYIEALPVRYVMRGPGSLSPAYVDSKKRLILVWRQVSLRAEQVPNAGPQHRSPVIDLEKTDFAVREITPRVRYILDDAASLRVGYYDRSSNTFFFWRGLDIKKPDAGFEAFEKSKVANDDVAWKIEVPIPATFWSSLFGLARTSDASFRGGSTR